MTNFRRFAAGVAEGFRTARFHQALAGMNDRQLADLGLARADISQRARELARSR